MSDSSPPPSTPTTGDVAIMKSIPSPVHMQMVMSKLKPLKDDVLNYVASPDSISRKSLSLLVNDSATGRPFSDFYDMNDVIGEGGFALVYSCRHKRNAKDYAVKEVIDENYEADGENLKEEIDALKRLREGPYVVRLFDVFREEDRTYVVMEEMKGGDLLERLTEKDHFSEKESRKISRTLLEAIGFCHRKKIVHRDIKPENILLADKKDDTTIKLADFGCARYMDDEFVEECKLTTLCGSPQYVAPELYTHEDGYDERCDLWSAGVVIFVILGGYAPFEAPTNELPEMITDGYFEFHPKYWIDISKPPKELIESLLEVNPDDRASVDEALDSEWLKRRDKEFMDESNGDFNDWLKRTSDINLNSITKLNLSFSDSYKEMHADLSESAQETQEDDDEDSSDSAKESGEDNVDDS